jgi:uncharacterized protein YcaQ
MKPVSLAIERARAIWLRAQRLDVREPFGAGPAATEAAIRHLGYVQIDTINVIERCHHHILFSRIPGYRRTDLAHEQSVAKSIFEYWTHALAYVPIGDFSFYLPRMLRERRNPERWGQTVDRKDYRRVIRMIRDNGPITIRDIEDDVLVEKEHLWASRKPSKGALQRAFWDGVLTTSARTGMLRTYELTERHFGWDRMPKPATERQMVSYLLDTAIRAQGIISIDSVVHIRTNVRPQVKALIESRVRKKELVPVELDGAGKSQHWVPPELLEDVHEAAPSLVHILSPFDPVVIQRKRLKLFFGYDHIFEAYVPKPKRQFGYFALPVLAGNEIVAALDLKTDRQNGKLLIQQWTWVGKGNVRKHKRVIEEELGRFEKFQLAI